MKNHRLVVVGAGPVGLEAALRAARDGFDVTVLEKHQIGQGIRNWGHVRFFTPFHMNSSELGRSIVPGRPDDEALLTGDEYCHDFLIPVAESDYLLGRVLEGHEVIAVSRATYGKSERIGKPTRAEQPFRILVRCGNIEQIFEADTLLDCTGFTQAHRFVGAGGMPCPGELQLSSDLYQIPGAGDVTLEGFAGQHTLVIGSGYSAATSICLLANLKDANPKTRITWLTKGNKAAPIKELPDDPLPERVQLAKRANSLATEPGSCVDWISDALVEKIEQHHLGYTIGLTELETQQPGEHAKSRAFQLNVDCIVANPGYRPNPEPFSELQIHRCYATEGPIKLAAHLLGQTSGDCLQQTGGGPELLRNPEPNFYIVGAASYGRDSRFLMQVGLRQVDELFTMFETNKELIG